MNTTIQINIRSGLPHMENNGARYLKGSDGLGAGFFHHSKLGASDAMIIVNFTPAAGFAGGLLIGVSASIMLWLNGRITGISGIVNGALARPGGEATWRWLFLLGLLAGAAVAFWVVPGHRAFDAGALGWPVFLVAGVLVGFGTRLGGGCTSGHGVCGLGRLSPRSLVATLTFLATGALTVFIVRHVLGVY